MEDKDLLDVYSAVSSFKGTENLFLDEEDFVEQINNNPDDVYEAISSFEGTTNLFLDKEDFYTQTGLKKNESQKQQQPQNEAITEGSQTVAEPLQESGENKYTVNDTAVTRDDILNNLDNEDFIEKVKKGEFNISVQGDVELQSKLSEKFKPPKYQKEFKEQDFFDGEFGAALKALDTATPFGIGEFIDDMGRAISGGQKQGAIVDDALYLMASGGDASEEKIQDYIDAVEVTQSQQTSDAMYNFQKELEEKAAKNESGEPDFFDVFSSLNMGVVPEIIVSSLSAMVNPSSLAAGGTVVGGAAAGGAIAGGGVGAIPAAIASTPYAMAAAGTTLETAVTFSDLIQEELAKEQKEFNKDNVKTLLEDTKKLNSMRSKAAGRGITIGVIDALTGKLGGSVGAKITSKTFRASKPLGVATASAIEAVGGSGGEAAGQLVAGQKFSPQEIVLEGIGEVGQAPINVAAALAKGNTQEKVQAVKDINEKVKKAAKVTGKPLYEMNGEPVSKEELNEIIESANVDDLEGMNVVVENDNEMTSKVESVMQLGVTKKKVMQANPNLDEDNVNKITKLQVELDNLKENDTEVANDRKKQLKESINEIINSQERTTVEQYGDKKEIKSDTQKKIEELEGILAQDAQSVADGNGSMLVDREAVVNELNELKQQDAQETNEVRKEGEQVQAEEIEAKKKENGFTKAGKESKDKGDGKILGKWILDNAKVGDTITDEDGNGYEVIEINRRGDVNIRAFEINENNEKVYLEGADAYRLVSKTMLKQGDLFEYNYTDLDGNRVIKQYKYNAKKETSDSDMSKDDKAELQEGKKAEEIKAGDTVNATVDVYESGKKVSKRFKVDVTSVNEDGTFNLKRGKLIYKNIKPNKIAKINPRNVTSINKETEGLTEKDRTKQGVDELVQSYKQKIKDTKEKLQSMLSDVKATSRDKQKALRDAGKAVSDFIKEAVPRGAKIPKSLVQYAARATTPKAVENVTQKIEDYINRSFVSEKKKSIIGKQKNIAKRLRGTSEYTNKEVAVQNLLASLNVSSIEDVALLEEIEAVLKDIENTPIAKVRDNQINDLTDRVSKYEPPKPKVKESISDLESKVNDAELTIRQRYLALNKLVNALNEKREASEDIMDEDVLALESKIEALSERLSEDLKEDIQETNKDTKELLKSVDTSDMSEQQKNMVNELKKAPISNDFKRSKQLNDIAIELSFGYAPIKKMQEYITSAKSEANSSATVDLIDKQATKRKTPFQEFISKSWGKYVIPKVFRIKGISNKSLRDTISDLRLEASDRWDDYFGLGKIKPIQKYVISPIETSITKMTEAASKSVKDLFNQGIIDKYSQRKIIMAVTQAYWDKYKTGENYWKDLIDNKTFRTNFPARYKELVNDFKGIEKNAEGKVDYNKILSNLKGKEKKVYDWIVKNNEKLLDKQRIANERRGQKFEPIDSRYYIPMKRKSDGLSIQGDDTFVDNLYSMFKDGATKLKSDRGEVRSSGKIQDINMDLYSLVADQIYQTNRDFYVTESVRQSVKTMSKIASRIQDEDAKKFATAMVNATKSRLGREFGSKPDGSVAIVNKVFSWLYQYVLMGPRLAPELVAETTRMSGAADIRMQPKALRLRASLGAVSEIMSFTGSPFLSNLYFENLDYISRRSFNKSAFGRFSEGVSSVNQKILSMPDTLTFNIVWIPSFLKEFKKVSGKEFNISEFNKNREGYLNSNEEFIKEASAFADSETQSVKGSKTRFSQREAVRILPEVVVRGIEAITGKKYGYADAQSVMGKLVTTLQNFAFLEQLNIGNNIREGIYAENKSRSRASSELVTAVASGTAYTYLASALYNYANLLIAENITGDDEDKEKAMDALQKLSSVDAVVDAAMSNALFLSTGKYGNVGKTGVLIILGLYDKYLKNTLPKDEYKKQREELIAMTRGRYFAEPIDLGGYKSESDILNALAPFIGRTLSIVGESVSGVVEGGSKILNGNSNEYVAMKLMNDIIKLLMITTGAPLPFQKDIDKMLKAKVKSMPNQNEKPKSRTINPNNTND